MPQPRLSSRRPAARGRAILALGGLALLAPTWAGETGDTPAVGGASAVAAPAIPAPAIPAPVATAVALDAVTLLVEPPVLGHERVRLAGIAPPQDGETAQAARDALARLVQGRSLRVEAVSAEPDRHQRLLAHVYRVDDGLWLQDELVARGLARVAFASDAGSPRLLPLEDEARRAGRGLWADRRYRVLASGEAHRHLGEVAIVEGVVVGVARAGGWLHLNFGGDWRTDFTASVRLRAVPAFAKAGVPLAELAGRRVRVRGFLDKRHGPSLELFARTQIEVLAADGPPPVTPPAAKAGPGDAPPGR